MLFLLVLDSGNYVLIALALCVPAMMILFIWYSQKVAKRFKEIEKQVGVVVPYWTSIQDKLIIDLTHPHPEAERVDELLQIRKNDPSVSMSSEEKQELLDGLARRAEGNDPKISESEKRKAAIFPLVMEEVDEEIANPHPMTEVQLVGVKKKTQGE